MRKTSDHIVSIHAHLNSLIVPCYILSDFEISKVEETEDMLQIYLIEKQERKPNSEDELGLNGYMNSIEIQSFPVHGKVCYLYLKRRRWKKKGTKEDLFNHYNYTADHLKPHRGSELF